MHHNTTEPEGISSVLATLRQLNPNRQLHFAEALRVAELQANRLLELLDALDVPVPSTLVTNLPKIIVEHDSDLPTNAASGSSHWDWHRRSWIISLNPEEPRTRQRFTVFHEYKHILDHGSAGIAAPQTENRRPPEEAIADYFAGCALIPKRLLRSAWYDGIHRTRDLAELFDVSESAVRVRLSQLGLEDDPLATKANTARVHRHAPLRRSAPRDFSSPYYRSAYGRSQRSMEVAV